MDVMYNDEGKAFLPASDLYKEFIVNQLEHLVSLGDRSKYDTRVFDLFHTLSKSKCFNAMEANVREEIINVLGVPYEVMAGHFKETDEDIERRAKNVREARIAFEERVRKREYPKLSLVK